uniref:Uncharacterized protein n=1 Tax=viral metagenome TaxID=1070528 RepID=A0A6C0J1A6_9ZZZZ
MGKYSKSDLLPDSARILKNGMLAGYVMIDGKPQFRIIGVEDREKLKLSSAKRRPGRRTRSLSPKGAMRAFNRHYNKSPKYKSPKNRKGAKSRDLCWDNQPLVRDARYSRSPHRYDYPGLDDGSRCEGGPRAYKNNYNPVKMRKGSKEALAWGKKMKSQSQAGGGVGETRPVSLKTAVKLLRQYYNEKYN